MFKFACNTRLRTLAAVGAICLLLPLEAGAGLFSISPIRLDLDRQNKTDSIGVSNEETARKLDIEYGQLQLEQSTWAMHARIEKIAGGQLMMRVPSSARIQVVPAEAAQ